jgi:hypothetical protein
LSLISATVLAWAVLACASPAPPTDRTASHEPATVVATWIADDASVVVLHVVVAPRTPPRELPRLASHLRARHPDSRVIVRVFASTAGPERFVIGRVPTGTEPIVAEPRPPTLLATYDFTPMAGR